MTYDYREFLHLSFSQRFYFFILHYSCFCLPVFLASGGQHSVGVRGVPARRERSLICLSSFMIFTPVSGLFFFLAKSG